MEGFEMSPPMRERQKAFCEEYLKDLNGTQAAIRAGYSVKGAHVQAAQLLSNPNVSGYLQKLKAERSERTKINADWMLRRLEQDASADMADLYDANGNFKHIKDWPMAFRTGLVAGVETMQMGEEGEITVKKVKLADRARYLEMIGKHIDVGAFKDKLEVEVLDSLAVRLERLRAKRAQK